MNKFSPASLMKLFQILCLTSTTLLIATASVTLKNHVIVHGFLAGTFFLSSIMQVLAATSLQSHMIIDAWKNYEENSDQDGSLQNQIIGQFMLKRKIIFSLPLCLIFVVLVAITLYIPRWATSAQLSEIIGALMQYITVLHVICWHVSYVQDIVVFQRHHSYEMSESMSVLQSQ